MKIFAMVIGLIVGAGAPYACNAQAIDDPFNNYLQRSVTISMGAGNASNTNAAIHTINPWPPYVGNTRIHTTGRQAVDSVQRMYRVPNPFEREGTTTTQGTGPTTDGAATSPTGAPVTPMQPISSGY